MDLKTLADVRDFLDHIPKERRQDHTWQVVARRLNDAASVSVVMTICRSRCRWRFNWNASNIGERHAGHGKPWSQQDDDDLRLEVSTGETIDHAATFLCRSHEEVMKRYAELGLQWNGAARPH